MRARPSAGLLCFVAPVGGGGVDVVLAEDFAGGAVGDGDGGRADEDEDWLSAVGVADAEVVHAAGSAEADLASGVDVVQADPVVVVVVGGGGGRFWGGLVGVGRGVRSFAGF